MEQQKVIISENLEQVLTTAIAQCPHDKLFVLTDETTHRLCLPLISGFDCMAEAQSIIIGATDANKTLDSLGHVWSELQRMGATRHSLMVNLGGGMVTDLGGFAASTFKRGIPYINIPTTLLSMVDASVGGKTGINFGGLKNEIGVFNNADCVILDTVFLRTMDHENLLSGYAEMLKHGLLDGEELWAETMLSPLHPCTLEPSNSLLPLIERSIAVKQRIVEADPMEQDLRKVLNLGHTVGHALESYSNNVAPTPHLSPLKHGYAVAFGLICELYLSAIKCGFPTDRLRQTVSFIREQYGTVDITCDDYDTLMALMHHDKKNMSGQINFTLLAGIGDVRINQTATDEEIREALDFLREG